MPFLSPRTQHHFDLGDAVRVKRHGYLRHYEGVIESFGFEDGYDTVHVRLDGGCPMGFRIGGDYAIAAHALHDWDEIPHPQSEDWQARVSAELAELDAELDAMSPG